MVHGGGELTWPQLSDILGQPVPYWPTGLRYLAPMDAWRPGDPQLTIATDLVVPIDEMLRLAITMEPGDNTRETLINLAQTIQWHDCRQVRNDIELVVNETMESALVLPAVPLSVPEIDTSDLDIAVRRSGWLPLLQRTDDLARTVLRRAKTWTSEGIFPYHAINELQLNDPVVDEWRPRLEPSPNVAAFDLLMDRTGDRYVDPASDTPVVIGQSGRCWTAVPQFLPSLHPMAEIVLGTGHQVWIRTEDGVIHLAPESPSCGIRWGYNGGSTRNFAALLGQLVAGNDVNAVTDNTDLTNLPKGLVTLATHAWPPGTVLKRDIIEAARHGNFELPPESSSSD